MILCGLSPNDIIECAGKGLSFWAYQKKGEIDYEHYRTQALSGRFETMRSQFNQMSVDAKSHISSLEEHIKGLSMELEGLKQQNMEVTLAVQEKDRKLLRTQELYDKLKRKAMLSQSEQGVSQGLDQNQGFAPAESFGGSFTSQSASQGFHNQDTGRGLPSHSSAESYGQPQRQYYGPSQLGMATRGPSGISPPGPNGISPPESNGINPPQGDWASAGLRENRPLATPRRHPNTFYSGSSAPGIVVGTPHMGRGAWSASGMMPHQTPGGLNNHLPTGGIAGGRALADSMAPRRDPQRPPIPGFSQNPMLM